MATTEPAKPPMGAVLADGLQTLDAQQSITFTKYVRVVLPLDGFVFWLRADMLSPSALYNAAAYNAAALNAALVVVTPAAQITVAGSFHFATQQIQEETESYANNRVTFTALEEVRDFNQVGPAVMFIGEFPLDGQLTRFAFSARGGFYVQSDLYHYTGDAIWSTMETQVIDRPAQLQVRELVVSNSLPFWLGLNQQCPIYPSFLVPNNLPPPYAVIHIPPEATSYVQPLPRLMPRNSSHYQLAMDRVKITTYGLRNDAAADLVDQILAAINEDGYPVGMMSGVIIQDEKAVQVELGVLAQKKRIELDVSYYQVSLRDVAQQLIISCVPTYQVQGQA